MPDLVLISNQKSGSGQADQVGDVLTELGLSFKTVEIGEASAEACHGASRILVAGGDGSVAPGAVAAAECGVPLGVIAVGTANDFAARMELPEELEQATRLAAQGEELRSVDLARAGGRPFVNVASLGLSPDAAEAAEDLKDQLGPLAYTAGAVRAGASSDPVRCRVLCDGGELFADDAWQVMVACTGAFGGGSELDARPDDGKLDVVVIEGGPRSRLAKHAVGMRTGTVEKQEGVTSSRCPAAEIEVEPDHNFNIDGEVVSVSELGEGGRVRFGVTRHAFELVVG